MTNNFTNKIFNFIKKTAIIALSIIFIITTSSCKKEITINNPIALGFIDNTAHIINDKNETLVLNNYDQVLPIFDTYLMVKKDDKWGFISNTGKEIMDIKYDAISRMKEDKAVVELDGKTMIINSSGETLYTFSDNMTSHSYFNENLLLIEKDGLLGYLSYNNETKKFNILVEPTYLYADIFYEGKAAVGKLITEEITENNETQVIEKVKYTYLNNDGTLFYNDFIFDEADRFSEGFAKVGTSTFSEMTYSYISNVLSSDNKLQYLTYQNTTKVVSKGYGTRMKNGLVFVADYVKYDIDDDNEATDYYKNYEFISPSGELKYEVELSNYSKPTPQSFLPLNPFYIDDTFIFLNGSKRTSVWNVVRQTSYQLFNDINNEYYVDYDFINVPLTLSEDDEIIKEFMEINDCNYKFATTYLGSPYEMGEVKFNQTLNQHIMMARIYGNRCGLISITTTPNENPKENNLDKFSVVVKYISSIVYDNIVY